MGSGRKAAAFLCNGENFHGLAESHLRDLQADRRRDDARNLARRQRSNFPMIDKVIILMIEGLLALGFFSSLFLLYIGLNGVN